MIYPIELYLNKTDLVSDEFGILLRNVLPKILTFYSKDDGKNAYCPKSKKNDCPSPFQCLILGCAKK